MRPVFVFLTFGVLFGFAKGGKFAVPLEKYDEEQRFFVFPDSNGKLHLIDAEAKLVNEERFAPEKDVSLQLYTRKNPKDAQQLIFGSSSSLAESNFDKSKPTKFIAHGWTDDGTSPINMLLRDDFLVASDANVVVFDWGKGASGLYTVAVGHVQPAGEFLGRVVDWLVGEGLPLSKVHVMGHSLGAHVAGIGGRSVTKGLVPYLTGLDPAMPLWGSGSKRIRSSDAAYVEIIHTNGGNAGLNEPLGHNDFYPNGGSHQPGCGVVDFGCSHARAWEYLGDSMDHQGYVAKQCNSYDEMNKGKCANLSSLHMGGTKPKPAVGIFYLETSNKKPFFLG